MSAEAIKAWTTMLDFTPSRDFFASSGIRVRLQLRLRSLYQDEDLDDI